MTTEEKAVIEAALAARDLGMAWQPWSTELLAAVDNLRESRKPRPRWRVGDGNFIEGPDGIYLYVQHSTGGSSQEIQRIRAEQTVALLNQADQHR